ncbi:MAG: hypothetical protein Ta2F_14560 [Termitinemataceae bacterium]|nr:MAG: hypothetical protein Ta2F_14560 [Termitinemataceae bacterium]
MHRFSGNTWDVLPVPSDSKNIFDLAVVPGSTPGTGKIYILSLDDTTATIYGADIGSWNWGVIGNASNYGLVQSIYAANKNLFAGARQKGSDAYAILNLNGNDFTEIIAGCRDLSGVVYADSNYYFATTAGIYKRDSNFAGGDYWGGYTVTGIFSYNATNIIAVTSDAQILQVGPSAAPIVHAKSDPFTGAIALWQKDKSSQEKLLLLGVKGGADDYGYFEVPITDKNNIDWGNIYEPGAQESRSSVNDIDSYRQQLKKHVVRALIQAPPSADTDPKNHLGLPVVFAATQKDGVWSYRATAEKPNGVWNAED